MDPKHPSRVSGKAMEYLREVVEYGFGNTTGPKTTQRFEAAFAKRFGVKFAVAMCNGTATLHACLAAAGVKPGDEVIVPPLTAASTSLAVMHQGAVPVFADLDEHSFNINPKSIRERISPLTKAIIAVGLYGLSADMDPIMEIAAEYNLIVIEDNAECFLATYKGRIAGTSGHMASFSFQASKHLTCGDGGIVITNDEKLATKVKRFATLGYPLSLGKGGMLGKEQRGVPDSIRHVGIGWNYRMSDLQGAVALEQTERIDELVGLRIKVAEMYLDVIRDCPWLTPQYTPEGDVNSYWTLVCRLNMEKAGCDWHGFRKCFFENGGDFLYGAWRLTYQEPLFQERNFIGGIWPIDSEVYKGDYRSYGPGLCPVAERIQPQLLQFKTNYMDLEFAKAQAEALRNTIKQIGNKK